MRASAVVVGGGPAGLAAAITLANGGVDTEVREAGSYGSPRLCGEFLSPDAVSALGALGVRNALRELDAPRLRAVRVTVSDGGRMRAEHGSRLGVGGWGVGRIELDPLLAHRARSVGVSVRERCRVRSLAGVEADVTIVATGRLGRPHGDGAVGDAGQWVAVKRHVRGLLLGDVTELHFMRGAYVGLNKVRARGDIVTNVCALVRADFWDQAGRTVGGVWETLAARSPPFAEHCRRARPVAGTMKTAAGFGFASRGSSVHGALVVGDAAAMITPLTGDGQAMALTGGVRAAELLLHVRRPDGSLSGEAVREAAGAWDDVFRRRYRARLAIGRALQGTLLNPATARFLVKAMSLVRPASKWIYRATRGPVTSDQAL